MTYLLDTNVLSEHRKARPDPGVDAWLAQAPRAELHLSVITVGEVRRGISRLQRRNDHPQATRYERWLTETLRRFAGRVVPIGAEEAQRWGDNDAARPMPVADGLIGATAQVRGWTLVTRNVKDFQHTGVALLNPFTT